MGVFFTSEIETARQAGGSCRHTFFAGWMAPSTNRQSDKATGLAFVCRLDGKRHHPACEGVVSLCLRRRCLSVLLAAGRAVTGACVCRPSRSTQTAQQLQALTSDHMNMVGQSGKQQKAPT